MSNIKLKYHYSPVEAITTADPTIKLPSDLVVSKSSIIDLMLTPEFDSDTVLILESLEPLEYSITPNVLESGEKVVIRLENHLNDKLVRYSGDPIVKVYVLAKSKALFIKEKK